MEINPLKWDERNISTPKNKEAIHLTLPVRDDFSHTGHQPDGAIWSDRDVFINQRFAIHPRTVGVATFDALDSRGQIHEEAFENSFQFQADFLTSHPIRLDSVFGETPKSLAVSDSVILTFYYQPQGRGSAPRLRDSLVVEFLHTPGYYQEDPYSPDGHTWINDFWVSKWSATGETLQEFITSNDSTFFKRVAIPVEEEVYFRKDFKFRFRNYASFPLDKTPDNYAGNISNWNIDYVMLDHGRSVADSFYYDIAFAAPAQSVLKTYQAMPWSHYITNPQAHHRSSFNVSITNLDNALYNYIYRYFVVDENNHVVRNYSGGTWNIAPFALQGYQTYQPHANPIVVPNPFGTLSPASAREFRVFHAIREGNTGDEWQRNDTIVFHQVFDNYFAYDDGVPENGYGLVGNNAKGAVRFILGHEDTIDAVNFYFNPTLNNQNKKPFVLTIWKNLEPEEILYESENLTVEFGQWKNQFVTYPLENPLIVSDTIYIGWRQLTNDFLHIGYDKTNDASQHIFHNTNGIWLPTIFDGALMIRPVFGPRLIASEPSISKPEALKIYPNPVKHNTLYIDMESFSDHSVQLLIFDTSGRMISSYHNQSVLDVAHLPNGIYLLQIRKENNQFLTSRFIIAR